MDIHIHINIQYQTIYSIFVMYQMPRIPLSNPTLDNNNKNVSITKFNLFLNMYQKYAVN